MAGGGSQSQEAMYDQRLFNQNKVMIFDDVPGKRNFLFSTVCPNVMYCSRVLPQVLARMTHIMFMINLGGTQEVQPMLCTDLQEIMTKIFMATILRN